MQEHEWNETNSIILNFSKYPNQCYALNETQGCG